MVNTVFQQLYAKSRGISVIDEGYTGVCRGMMENQTERRWNLK